MRPEQVAVLQRLAGNRATAALLAGDGRERTRERQEHPGVLRRQSSGALEHAGGALEPTGGALEPTGDLRRQSSGALEHSGDGREPVGGGREHTANGGGPLPVQRAKRSKAARRARQRARARQRQQQQPAVAQVGGQQGGGQHGGPAPDSGWSLGGLLSSAWGSLGFASEAEGDSLLSGDEHEEQLAGEPEEDEEESLFNMPKLVIDLGEMNPESGDLTPLGGKAKASGSARLKAGAQSFEGSGGIEAEVGFDKNKELGPFDYNVAGGQLSGKGEVKGFFGVRVGGEAEASWSGGTDVAAKGKLSAFSGLEVEGETEITVKGSGRELAHFKGALGMTVGAGGELGGHISYKGGEFRFGSKGKVAAGLGFSWEYELHCSIAPLGSGMWSFLKSLGAAAHAFLTDEDGEPIHL